MKEHQSVFNPAYKFQPVFECEPVWCTSFLTCGDTVNTPQRLEVGVYPRKGGQQLPLTGKTRKEEQMRTSDVSSPPPSIWHQTGFWSLSFYISVIYSTATSKRPETGPPGVSPHTTWNKIIPATSSEMDHRFPLGQWQEHRTTCTQTATALLKHRNHNRAENKPPESAPTIR